MKTVIVTGAGSGIGAATAKFFSEAGYQVVLVGRRKEKLEAVSKSLKTKSLCLSLDITDPKSSEQIVKQATEFGDLSTLVNNAGTYERGPVGKCTDASLENMFRIHVAAPLRLIQACLLYFEKRGGGSIVNVSSSAAFKAIPGMTAYGSMKSAMNYLTQTCALELAAKNIRVNAVCPGIVETEILGLEKLSPEQRSATLKEMADMHPLKRTGKPIDVARVIYDLAKEESSWMTGVTIPIDGGVTLV